MLAYRHPFVCEYSTVIRPDTVQSIEVVDQYPVVVIGGIENTTKLKEYEWFD